MLADIVTLLNEADHLRWSHRSIDALDRYREVLDRLRVHTGSESAALLLRARAARSAAAILIHQDGDLDEIYTLLADERAALINMIEIPLGHERLYRHLSAFVKAVNTDEKNTAKQAFISVLTSLFGRGGPAEALDVHLAIIQNTLVKAEVIFDRESDLDDARALVETALSEILALLPNTTISVASHPAIPLLTNALDLLARFQGHDARWFNRAKIVCTLLPTAPTPWSMGLIQSADIAALLLGLGEPEAV